MTRPVLFLIADLIPGSDGRQTIQLARALRERGEAVHVAALAGGSLEEVLTRLGAEVHVLSQRAGFDLSTLRNLQRLAAHVKPRLVHAWGSRMYGWGLTASKLAKAPLLMSLREVGPGMFSPLGPAGIGLQSRVAKVVLNCRALESDFLAAGWTRERVAMISDGIAPPQDADLPQVDLTHFVDLPTNGRLIGTAAPLELRSHLKDALWATDLLKVLHDDVHLIIVGDGPQRPRLVRFRRLLELADRVHFLPREATLEHLLPRLSVYWQPGPAIGQGPGLLAASAAGVPVIAADTAGNREAVAHQQTGFLMPLGDRGELASHTQRLLNEPQLGQQLGTAGRAFVSENFSTQKMLAGYFDLYNEIST